MLQRRYVRRVLQARAGADLVEEPTPFTVRSLRHSANLHRICDLRHPNLGRCFESDDEATNGISKL